MALSIYYDKDADLGRLRGQAGRGDRLRQPGPCARAEPARLGRLRDRRPPEGLGDLGQGRRRRTSRGDARRGGARGADRHADPPRRDRRRHLRARDRAEPRGRGLPRGRARLQHPLPRDQPAARRLRLHGRAEGPGPHRARALRAGPRRAVPRRGRPGPDGRRAADRARVREGHRRRPGRHHRDDVPRRDRDRSVRRADRSLRRAHAR